ncbi:MAG: PHP domain-containing protein [Lachnospiraceae bacterium]|jgi:predicted metal-dependent phosphoesterase TrpH|nr:PHP domain-containing protein [Lachnospiraceae bacterium]MEE3460873.1 PHP domain-containing protein [Lachnospiraceae bacterium]
MRTADLHTHTTASDGSCTPAELVKLAYDAGLSAVAITDHDSVNGIAEALKAENDVNGSGKKDGENAINTGTSRDNNEGTFGRHITVIPGIEISSAYKSGDIHIVGLFVNPDSSYLKAVSDRIIESRHNRNMEMLERFNKDGIPITEEDLLAGNPDTVVTRAHFAAALVKHGLSSNTSAAFKKYLDTNCKYYVPRRYIPMDEAIDTIKKAGGVAVMAHPLQYRLDYAELDSLVKYLTGCGLTGIEVKYPSHSYEDERKVSLLARKYRLLPSGGSDFHGSAKPDIHIGTGRGSLSVPYLYAEKLAGACNYPI